MAEKTKILICGILPPPFFGHSAMYKILMDASFVEHFDITFLNMRFWSYGTHKRVTLTKILKLVKYLFQYVFLIVYKRPRYVLYNMSFDKMPFLKDVLFCGIGRFLGRRIVIHDMGQYIKELYDASSPIYQKLIRWLMNNATASIMLGEHTKAFYDGFLDPKRLFAVPGSVEDSMDIPTEGQLRGNSREINVLYFSFLSISKGVLTAFDAVSKVLHEKGNIKFIFAGPAESEDIEKRIDQLKERFEGHVEYLGYVGDPQERTEIYRHADIFIFPTHRDVFGLVLLHAMAEKLPIVASIEGCIPEIVDDQANGFLIPKGDSQKLAEKILSLANNQELRTRMGEASRKKYLDTYAPDKYGERMIKAFEAIEKLSS